MATTFETYILHSDRNYAEQAAYAAYDELDRLEGQFSKFIENSDISQINRLSAGQSMWVGCDVFRCLELCGRIYIETEGAFDITFGSSVKGCQLELDSSGYTVRQPARKVVIDLGGVGKGYAVDKMAEVLGEWGIESTLIVGGYSSVLAMCAPSDKKGWPVTLRMPDESKQILKCLYLKNRAVGASGLQHGRHIINPHTGEEIRNKLIAWAVAKTAGVADALSTAFMVMAPEQIERYCRRNPEVSAMVVARDGAIQRFGVWEEN
jgi:thiamine biosynthesis lipoprotein